MKVLKLNLTEKPACFCLLLLFIVLTSLSYARTAASADPPAIYVVNYPLKYFAERIGGNRVKVVFPVPPDIDPAYWEPEIAVITQYQKADLILLNGAGYAKWTKMVNLPRSKVVDTSRRFKNQYVMSDKVVTHSHGPEGEHAHEALMFTTWLDFKLAAKQAEEVCKAMIRKRPGLKKEFIANLGSLQKDLLMLDARLESIVSKNSSLSLIFSHPVYDYLIKRYKVNARSVHWEPDKNLTAEQIEELREMIQSRPAGWMIWENDPTPESVEKLKAMGVKITVFKPCANIPDSGDFMSVMKENLDNMESVYR